MKVLLGLEWMSPETMIPAALRAEEEGFFGVSLADHASNPRVIESSYPYATGQGGQRQGSGKTLPSPLVMIGAMAAVTTRLCFTTSVLVVPLRHPILLAKEIATTARLAPRRLDLGVGIGWMREEFEAMNVDFSTRARRMEEMLELMPRFWRGEFVESDTEQFCFRHNQVLPALDDPPPILIGGHSDPALRRAARLGDGWVSAPCAFEEIARVVEQLATERRYLGREEGEFEIRMFVGAPPSWATLQSLADLGVSSIVLPQYLISDRPDSLGAVLDGISSTGEMIRSWRE